MAKRQVSFGRLVFGPDVDCKTIRKYWEPSSPTTQCNNIIGPFKNGIKCYICGMKINRVSAAASSAASAAANESENENNDSVEKDGRDPECEHILPIADAVVYLGLYSPKFKSDPWYSRKVLDFEYKWAHRTCNQIKSDDLYIKNDKGSYKFIVDTEGLNRLLTKIWNTDRVDSQIFKKELHEYYRNSLKDFLNLRLGKVIVEGYVTILQPFQLVCDYLNTFKAPGLVLLAGVCKALHGPMSIKAKEALATRDPAEFERQQAKKFQELRKAAEEEYFKLALQVIQEMLSKTVFAKSGDILSEYNEEVAKRAPIFVSLATRISNELFEEWKDYVTLSLKQIFFEVLKVKQGQLSRAQAVAERTLEKEIETTVFKNTMESLRRSNYPVNEATVAAASSAAAAAAASIIASSPVMAGVKRRANENIKNIFRRSLPNSTTRKKTRRAHTVSKSQRKYKPSIRVSIKSLPKNLRNKYSLKAIEKRKTLRKPKSRLTPISENLNELS